MSSDTSITRSKTSPLEGQGRVIDVQASISNHFIAERKIFEKRLTGKFTAILLIPFPLLALGISKTFYLDIVSAAAALPIFFTLCIIALIRWMWNSPVKCFCGECRKYVPSDIEWKCGFCDFENKNTDKFSFLYRCENCEKAPLAYQCHHCNVPVFLSHEKQLRNMAVKLGQTVVVNRELEIQTMKASRQERKEELEFEIQIAALNKQLAALRAESEPPKPKSHLDFLRSDVDEHVGRFFGADKLVEEKLKEAQSDPYFSNDPRRMERYRQALEHWRDQNMV